jgi:putative glutamine amidotransferase
MDKRIAVTADKPLIGITRGLSRKTPAFQLIRLAVYLCGGRSIFLRPENPCYETPLDGIIFSGGTDVHPARYGDEPKPQYRYDPARDEMELRWFEIAEQQNLPVLGICRGAQLMNIARGGSLVMDISKAYEKAHYPSGTIARIFYRKGISIQEESLLRRHLNARQERVNSMHTQAVDTLGDHLKITATESNGIVQAIEDIRHNRVLGVQFHPEFMLHRKKFRRLFRQVIQTTSSH